LSLIPYEDLTPEPIVLPPRQEAAPGKFESKRFCFNKKVSTRWYVTFIHIFVVLYMKEPFYADAQTALSR
jgi:hypothetical protein